MQPMDFVLETKKELVTGENVYLQIHPECTYDFIWKSVNLGKDK